MFIKKKDADELLNKFTKNIVNRIEDKYDFLKSLLKESDWAFVIKAHAMIEAAVTELIVQNIGDERLITLIERLPLSDTQAGKIVAVKNLNLLDAEQRKFIRFFSELRNKLVHKVENVDFAFESHIKKMDNNQKKQWSNSIVWFHHQNDDVVGNETWKAISLLYPKISLFMAILLIISDCVIQTDRDKGINEIEKLSDKTMKELFSDE